MREVAERSKAGGCPPRRARARPRRRRPEGGACLPSREGGPPQGGPEGCVTGPAGHPQVCFAHLGNTPQSRLPPCQLPSKGSPCDSKRQGTVLCLHFQRQRTSDAIPTPLVGRGHALAVAALRAAHAFPRLEPMCPQRRPSPPPGCDLGHFSHTQLPFPLKAENRPLSY